MIKNDRAARRLGLCLENIGRGSARISMTVRPAMCNGLATCHGGIIFTLADAAMAYASNTYGPAAVAASASIDYLRPALAGEKLIAVATEHHRSRRTGVYQVEVKRPDGDTIAIFRGRVIVTEAVKAGH
jgi:acyl-CoA thioesterase